MKIKIKLLIICFLVNLKLSAQYQIVPPDSIPSTILSISKSFAFDFYNFSKPKNFTKFLTEKGDLYFLKSYDIKIQTHYSNEIYKEYGNITKVVLHQILKDSQSNYILRYKGYYDKKHHISEIRIDLNSQYKFSGISIYPWFILKFIEYPTELKLEKIALDSLNSNQIEKSYEFAYKSFKCNSSNFMKLTSENAIQSLRNWSTIENMNSRCESIYNEFGSLENIKLNEVLSDNVRTIYRYKAKYNKTEDILEIIVVANIENKFIGNVLIGKWRDVYVDFTPEKKE